MSGYSKHGEESSRPADLGSLKVIASTMSDVESSSESEISSIDNKDGHYPLGRLEDFLYKDYDSWPTKKEHNKELASERGIFNWIMRMRMRMKFV